MRILHLLPHLSGGGAERQFSYLAPLLATMGHEVHVAYLYEGPQRPELHGVFLNQLKFLCNHDPYLLWQLIRLLRRIQPDIVQTWIPQMDILGGIAAKITGVPWILREPSSAMAYPPTWKNRLRVLISSFAKKIISNSSSGKSYWGKQRSHCNPIVIQNGLPLGQIDEEIPKLPFRGNVPSCPIVLCVARIVSGIGGGKNITNFVEVIASVKTKHAVLGVICGQGSRQKELMKLVNGLGLSENVIFTGWLSTKTVWAMMKKASAFVSLSAYEGCPNAVMEAMACKCPLIISDIPAHREILDEKSAVFVDPTNTSQVASAVLDVLLNTDKSRERARIARKKAESYSTQKMASRYVEIYKKALEK